MITLKDFLYRQGQRFKYHFSHDPISKRIAEINRHQKVISASSGGNLFHALKICLPLRKFDFIFQPLTLDLFLSLPSSLNGEYYLVDDRLFFRFDDLKIEITSKSELYIIKEIFVEKCYQFLLPENSPVHVVDIGMNVGLASLFFAGLPNVKMVHSFEPFPSTFIQAIQNLKNNSDQGAKVKAHNIGLGSKEENLRAHYNCANNGTNKSVTQASLVKPGQMETLQIKPASSVLNSLFCLYPDEPFILKVDTEGAEYDIFESLCQKEISRQVKGVMLEWHDGGSQVIERRLLENGFAITSFRFNANSGMIYAFR